MSQELWCFKHAPKTLDEYIATPEHKAKLQKTIDELQNTICYGSPGTGKSNFVKILKDTTGYDMLTINASDESGINTIRDKVKPFAYTMAMDGYKVVYLNEADRLTQDAMEMLRALMEEVHNNCRFILVANDISGIHEALLSRCQQIEFNSSDAAGIVKHCMHIIQKENVDIENKDKFKIELVKLVKSNYPDIRRIITTLQASVINNKISNISDTANSIVAKIIDEVFNCDIDEIRLLLRNNNVRYQLLYDELYSKLDKFNNLGDAILCINEGMLNDKIAGNKEINFLATVCKLIKNQCICS